MSQSVDLLSESQLFIRDKQAWENAIATYKGIDALELWFNYICWYDYNIHVDPDNKFQEVLEKCLSIFEHNDVYKQDVRMIKLWVKYIDLQPNPLNLYQILYQRGIGTQCASFYIGWAHYYDSANAFKQAESVYNLGFQAKAEPYNELQDAHTKFRLSISQRMLYNDSSSKRRSFNNLVEQRHQITTLTPNSSIKKNKLQDQQSTEINSDYNNTLYQNHVSSRNQQTPQQLQQQQHHLQQQQTLSNNNTDQDNIYNNFTTTNKQNDLNNKNNTMYIIPSSSSSSYIVENNETIKLENVKLPSNFTHYARNNFETWKPLLFIEEAFESSKKCCYQKHLVYPNDDDTEYSPEELRSKKWFQKSSLHQQQSIVQPPQQHQQQPQLQQQFPQNIESSYVENQKFDNYHPSTTTMATQCSFGETQNTECISKIQYATNDQNNFHNKTNENLQVNLNNDFYSKNEEFVHEMYNNNNGPSRTIIENNEHYHQREIHHQYTNNQSSNDTTTNNKNKMQHHYFISPQQQIDNIHYQQNNDIQYGTITVTEPSSSSDNDMIGTYHQLQNSEYLQQQNQTITNNLNEYKIIEHEQQQTQQNSSSENNYQFNKIYTYQKNEQSSNGYYHHNKSSQTIVDAIHLNNEIPSTSSSSSLSSNKTVTTHTIYENFEDQIEASTIHFSTDANDGGIKSKTITIKFRKEIPSSSPIIEHKQNSNSERKKRKSDKSTCDDYYSMTPVRTTKTKKVKKIKFINNYNDDLNNSKLLNNHDNIVQSSYNKNKTISTIHHNDYEDVNNLLLSPTQTFSDDSNTTNNCCSSLNISQRSDDSMSNNEFNITISNESSNYFSSTTSKLSQKYSSSTTMKTPITTQIYRNSKGLTTKFSLQSDDSICSYEQNSFFTTETDEEFEQRKLKALTTIDMHLLKPALDPFNSELCKAFLTKLDFPKREANDSYKLINTPIPKLANTKTTVLADITYNIEKEVGRGSYGSVYKAVDTSTGAVVAIKYQRPPNVWEVYICNEVKKRIRNYNILPGFMNISSAIIAPNASIIVTEFSSFGSLLDVNNKIRQATKKVMHESLTMHFSSQILDIVNHLHSCKIIHADIKPDNFLLMKVPNSDSVTPSLRLIDFGCAIDMTLFPDKMQFKKIIQTDGFTCVEMQEGKPWSYQTDLFCTAGTIHVILFGEYMQLVKKYDQWDIKQKLPRYLKKHVWNEFFAKMLNIKDIDNLPNLEELKILFDTELVRMNSELQANIRTLSNILYRR